MLMTAIKSVFNFYMLCVQPLLDYFSWVTVYGAFQVTVSVQQTKL